MHHMQTLTAQGIRMGSVLAQGIRIAGKHGSLAALTSGRQTGPGPEERTAGEDRRRGQLVVGQYRQTGPGPEERTAGEDQRRGQLVVGQYRQTGPGPEERTAGEGQRRGQLERTRGEDSWWPTSGAAMEANTTPANGGGEAQNDTNGTLMLYPWGDSLYPSGYSTLRIVLTSIVVTLIMVVVVVGNMLVIIAIATEKALKGIQNWFIASLAVADFMVGLIIMPFSLAQELMGYWLFGELWCSLHAAIDVLACTSSINNICLISLDRYWSITQAVDYLKSRTPRRAILMIAFVWLFSALICIPPLLGWRKKRVQSEFPKCELSDDIGYVLYSALGSFYIPSIIMIFVYIRIYFAARSRARRYVKRRPRACPVSTAAITAAEVHHDLPPSHDTDSRKSSAGSEVAPPSRVGSRRSPPRTASEHSALAVLPAATPEANGLLPGSPPRRQPASQGGETEQSSSESGHPGKCTVVLPLRRHFRASVWGRKTSKAKREMIDMGRLKLKKEPPPPPEPVVEHAVRTYRDTDREKRRIARKKEKRATLILGLIMGSFIACWLPFFFLYVLTPLCESCQIADWGFAFAFWLGYMNSALNPVIYTIFNKDFRRAFRRILFK
ncbi:alpha-2C adrenergic receptor-like [Pollicipes pollicipes]|uniref:alpha-2C adrenergic receptor-like n=1 Tax=Pollicipes pollicipes TaxID=41117 RepID=UPI0018855734|nr:alpha-2C adrenergic receptor-like [Pollicipes pollicipes]